MYADHVATENYIEKFIIKNLNSENIQFIVLMKPLWPKAVFFKNK